MISILYISPIVPVSKSPHAGGQTAHYYVKKLKEDSNVNLKIICSCGHSESKLFSFMKEDGLCGYVVSSPRKSLFSKILNKFSSLTYGFISKESINKVCEICIKIKNEGFLPDRVVFDWEETCFMLPKIKEIFPHAFYSVVEQDVKYQSLYRYYKFSKNPFRKLIYLFSYKRLLAADKKYFHQLDEIVVISNKDKKLIEELYLGIKKCRVIVPYYHDYFYLPISEPKENTVVFLGFMKRLENIEAVAWFIEKVMPLVPDVKFVVMGGGVPDSIKIFASEKVVMTGFVDFSKIDYYYQNALCMAVPLIHGAGVKIKVIEAMSAGMPVLTNDIGIEGINAKNGRDYYHCVLPQDYEIRLKELMRNKSLRVTMGTNARNFIKENLNYKKCSYVESCSKTTK